MHGELVPVPRSALDTPGALGRVERGTRVGLGVAGLLAHGAFVAVAGRPPPDGAPAGGPALLAGAALGVAMEVERRALHTAESMLAAGSSVARGVSHLPIVRGPSRRFESWLVRWNAYARVQQRQNRAEAHLVVRRVVQQVTDAVLHNVDFVHIVEQIPMNEIIDKIDLDAIIAKVDIAGLVNDAMKEIDLGGLIRESTEGVTAEAVDVVRSQTVKTDLFVSKVVDRVLFRRTPRDLTVPGAPGSESAEHAHP